MTAGEASKALGFTIGVGTTAGVLLAAGANWLLERRLPVLAPLRVLRVAAAACLLATVGMFVVQGNRPTVWLWLVITPRRGWRTRSAPGLATGSTHSHLRGRMMAIWAFSAIGSASVTPLLIGALSDYVFAGRLGLLWSCTCVAIACNALALVRTVELDRGYAAAAARHA